MKKILSSLIIAGLLLVPLLSFAVEQAPAGPQTIDELIALITKVTNWIFSVLLVVAALFLILAAYNFITAGGDPAKVMMARSNVMYALIGVAVAVIARGLVTIVKTIIGT